MHLYSRWRIYARYPPTAADGGDGHCPLALARVKRSRVGPCPEDPHKQEADRESTTPGLQRHTESITNGRHYQAETVQEPQWYASLGFPLIAVLIARFCLYVSRTVTDAPYRLYYLQEQASQV